MNPLRPTHYPAQPTLNERLESVLRKVDEVCQPHPLDMRQYMQADGYREPDEITFLHALTVDDAEWLQGMRISAYD